MSIGITGYGVYIPRLRIKLEEIARVWGRNGNDIADSLGVEEKAVADIDEDTITMAVEAAKNAVTRAQISSREIGALFVGSESHPYAVKPSGTVVAEAIGAGPQLYLADYEFACKAGTAAMQTCYAFAKAGEIKYGLAIGSDTAQGRPGDALEFTAASGAAAFIIGHNPLAEIEGIFSYTTDTASFWRREGDRYPNHGGRFTGEPAYFKHVVESTKGLMEKLGLKISDFDKFVFHMPNGKFPIRVAKLLGVGFSKISDGLVVRRIGNTYSGSSLLGLCATLDASKPGERIFMTSYGSGDGSDSFSFIVNDKIEERRGLSPSVESFMKKKKYIDYGIYVKIRGKLNR